MPDKKDYAALMNAAEAKAASQAAPAKDYAGMMNAAESGATPAVTATQAAAPSIDTATPAAVDPVTNEALSWQSGEGFKSAPHTMQTQVGLTKEQVQQAMAESAEVFTRLMRNMNATPATTPGPDVAPTSSSPNLIQQAVSIGDQAMRDTYKREVQSSLDFIRKDYAAHAKDLEGYWVSAGEKTAIPTQIGRPITLPDGTGVPTVANAEALNNAYENRLVDPTRDPNSLKQYIEARKSLLQKQRAEEIAALPPVDRVQGTGSALFGVATSPALDAVNKKYDQLESDFTNATAGLAYLKVVNSFMQEKKPLNARQLGIEVQKVLGDSKEMERQERLSRKGIEQPAAANVNNEIVGYRAMQYAAREAAADGRDAIAKQLYDRSENYMDKVRANNPKFVKEQRIAAIREGIADANSNVLRNTLIGYSPTQEDIDSYARSINIDPTGITPEDIGNIAPAFNRAVGSFINSSAGGLYTSGMRVLAGAAEAVKPGFVDWDKFNDHYNENWYDNTFLGGLTTGKLTRPSSQLFQGQSRVNTQGDENYLMTERNPNSGSFTWDASAIVNQMADGLGQIAAFGAVSGRLSEGAQASGLIGRAAEGTAAAEAAISKADRIGTALNVALTQYNNSYNEALQAIGDDDSKANAREAYALIRMISSAGTEMILPDAKIVRDIFGPGTAAGRQLIDQVARGGFRTMEHSALKNLYVEAVKGGVKDWAKETSEDVLDQVGTFVADQLLAPKKAADTDYLGELKQTLVTSAISSFLPTATGGARRQMANPAMNAHLLYQVGSNPDQYIDELNSQVDDGSLTRVEANEKIKVVNTMSEIVANGVPKAADGSELPRDVQVAYANNLLQSTLLESQRQGVKDAALQENIDTQLNALRAKRLAILTQSVTQAPAEAAQEITEPAAPPATAPSGGIQSTTPLRQPDPIVEPLQPTMFVEDQPTIGSLVESGRPLKIDGQRAELSLDGQRVIATISGTNREYEVGNIDQLRDAAINAVEGFNMEAERPDVSITNQGRYHIRGQFYANNYSDPTSAINYDDEGNVVSVNLDTEDGQKRTFRGQTAEDIAYQIHLQQLATRNEQPEFKDFLERDDEATQQLDRYAGAIQQTAEGGTAQAAAPVQAAEGSAVQQPAPVNRPVTDPNNPFQQPTNETSDNQRSANGDQLSSNASVSGQPGGEVQSAGSSTQQQAGSQATQSATLPSVGPVSPGGAGSATIDQPSSSQRQVDQRFGFVDEQPDIPAPSVGVTLPPIPSGINLLEAQSPAAQAGLPPVSIDNFDQLLTDAAARLSISSNGQQIGFEEFDVTIDRSDNTAQVNFVRKTNRAENKGIGLAAYIELGTRLAAEGITLESRNQAQLPGGRSVWNSLVSQGLAERVGNGQYVFKAPASTSNTAGSSQAGAVGAQVVDRYNSAPKIEGRQYTRTLPDGTQMPGRYILTTSEAATPSHDPATFGMSAGFPTTDDGRSPNDRNYSLPENSQRVIARAQNYDGRAVENVPTVDENGVVIDGNDRVMSGQIAAQQGTDAAYIAALRANAEAYGFTSQQVDDMIAQGQSPRLLFQVDQAQPYTTETFARFNPAEAGKAKSAQEQAVQLGRTLPSSAARVIGDAIAPFSTMSDFYGSPNASRAVRDALVQAGVLTADSLPRYFNAQRAAFTEEGKQLLQNLMLGQVLDEDAISILASNPALQQKMMLAIKNLLAIEQNPDFSLKGLMSEALQLKTKVDAYAAETGIADKKKALEQYLQAGNLFEAMPSFPAIALYVEIEQPSQKSVVNFTKNWLAQIQNYVPGVQEDLFGERQPTRAALIAQLTDKVGQYEQYANRSAEQQITPAPAAQPQQSDAGGPAADVRANEQAAEPATQVGQSEGGSTINEQAISSIDRTLFQKIYDRLQKLYPEIKVDFTNEPIDPGMFDNQDDVRFQLFDKSDLKRNVFGKVTGVKTAVLTQIEAEKKAIIEEAKREGYYLRAPNGSPTNLNPDQWVLVRTRRFKEWFGDWQGNPAKASSIVDANGEPKVYYSGSSVGFDAFDKKFFYSGEGAMYYGAGFYFTSVANTAASYSRQSVLMKATASVRTLVAPKFSEIQSLIEQLPIRHSAATVAYTQGIIGKLQGELNELSAIGKRIEPKYDLALQSATNILRDVLSRAKSYIESPAWQDNGNIQKVYQDEFDGAFFPFDSMLEEAERYGVGDGAVFQTFLNVRSPLDWEQPAPIRVVKQVATALRARGLRLPFMTSVTGGQLYKQVAEVLGEPFVPNTTTRQYSETSNLFSSLGIGGVIHTTQVEWKRGLYFNQQAGDRQVIVFEPNNIKSVNSSGAFSTLSNNINYQTVDNQVVGVANLKAMSILVDAINQRQDTLPHEYAHHYIAWFRDTPIVQEGISRFGSEEALVQAIGEQVVKQKGEAYNWWKRFTNWLFEKMSDGDVLQSLTDAFLTRADLRALPFNPEMSKVGVGELAVVEQIAESSPVDPEIPSAQVQAEPEIASEGVSSEGGPAVIPSRETIEPVRIATNGKPEPTGDARRDAANEFAWRQSVLDAKLLRMERIPDQIRDEEDAMRLAESAMARADEGSNVYKDNKKVADAARANLTKLRNDLNSTRVTLDAARKNVEDARVKMEKLMSKSADAAEATAARDAARQSAAQEAGVADDGSAQSQYEIARAENDVAEANVNRLVARLEEIKDAEQTPEWAAEVARIKDELLAARKAKRTAGQRLRRASAKGAGDAVRAAKTRTDIITANVAGISPQLYNAVIELIASAVEGGVSVANAIQQGVDYINDRWFTKWNEQALRNLLGENQLVALTPDEMRAHVESRIPLSRANEAAAKGMLTEIRNNQISFEEAMDYIDSLKLSAGVKASVKQYVTDYAEEEVFKPQSIDLADSYTNRNAGDLTKAIEDLLNNRQSAIAALPTPQSKANTDRVHLMALTELQTRRATAQVLDGTLTPNYNRETDDKDSVFPSRDFGPLFTGKGSRLKFNKENFEVAKRKVLERFQNRYRTAEEVSKRAKEALTEDNEFSDAFHLKQSRADAEKEEMQAKLGYITAKKGTLFGDMHRDGISFQEMDMFMWAQHAPERNAWNAQQRESAFKRRLMDLNQAINGATNPVEIADIQDQIDDLTSQKLERAENRGFVLVPDGGIGMTNEQAKKELDKVAQMGKTGLYESYAERFRTEVTDHTLDLMYENDLISAEKYNHLRRSSSGSGHYQFYVPAKVSDTFFAEDSDSGKNSGDKKRGSALIFRSRGAADIKVEDRVSPIQQALLDLEAAIQAKWDNKAGYVMGNFIEQNPDDAWAVVPAVYKVIRGERNEAIARIPINKPADVVYEYKKNGNVYYITSTNPGIKNMFAKAPGEKVAQFLSFIPRWFSAVRTRYSPEFILKNPLIDGQDAAFALMAQDDKRYIENFRKIGKRGQFKIFQALNGKQNEYTALIDEARKRGGLITFFSSVNTEKGVEKVLKLYESLDSKNPLSLANRRRVGAVISGFTDSLEEMTRARVYIAARETGIQQLMDTGMSRQEAEQKINLNKPALIARNATIDFGKRGVYGMWMNVWKTFANAATLGAANNVYFATKKGPGGQRARLRLAFMVAAGMAMSELARVAGDCDDLTVAKEDCWDEQSEYDKQRNLMIPWFMVAGKGSGYLKIPLGRVGYGTFTYIGSKLSDAIHGKTSLGNFTSNILGALGETYDPAGQDTFPLGWLGNFSTPFALWFNENPRDNRPIYPERDSELRSQSYNKNTPDIYVYLANRWHEATGGAPGKASNLQMGDEGINWGEVSPNQMEFFARTIGGGVYTFISNTASGKVPFLRTFAASGSMSASRDAYNRLANKSENQILSNDEQSELKTVLDRLLNTGIITEEQREKRFNFVERNQTSVIRGIEKANSGDAPAVIADPESVNTEGSVGTEGSTSTEGSISTEGSLSTEGSAE